MSLRQTAIESADVCLKYYANHPEDAIFRTGIRSMVSTLFDGEIVLTLEKKLKSTENLTIRIGKNQSYTNDSENRYFKVSSLNQKKVTLTEVSEELVSDLENALQNNNECWFESDKTFLVKRVKVWYENYGDRIGIPIVKPKMPVSFHPGIPVSDNQKEAIRVAMTSPFSYIWGAPGTGKTKHVLASCIYSYLKEGKKVLISAPTNTALDQSLSGILEALSDDETLNIRKRTLRLGIPEDNIGLKFHDVTEEAVCERLKREISQQLQDKLKAVSQLTACLSIRSGKSAGNDDFPNLTTKDIKSKIVQLNKDMTDLKADRSKASETDNGFSLFKYIDLVAATTDACIFSLPPGGNFTPEHIFLDEAGYCSVIKGMPFTAYNCPLTLLGDHMQLPPVCDVDPKREDQFTEEETSKLFMWRFSSIAMEPVIEAQDYSRFKNIKDLNPTFHHLRSSSLVETHRFGPKLANILANTVYDSNFISNGNRDTRIWVIDAPKLSEDIGINPKTGKRIRFSHNEEEAIIQLILNNINTEIIEEIGILTPYKEYRRQLKTDISSRLKKHHYNDLVQDNIMTIHQSQGNEWEVVIVSVVDSLEDYWDSYFMNTNKDNSNALKIINTAVSRAKQLLIIICDMESWRRSPDQFISRIINIAEQHKATDNLPVNTEVKKETPVAITVTKPADMESNLPISPSLPKAGETVLFGKYQQDSSGIMRPIEWKILKTDSNKALLISKKCLDVRSFSKKHITSFWGKSSIRTWLNESFYNDAFTSQERSAIFQTIINNSSVQSDTSAFVLNSSPTKDHVFLLSYSEAKDYFKNDKDRSAFPTEYALSLFPADREKAEKGISVPINRWLLRSNSQDSFKVSVVDSTGQLGRRSSVKSKRLIRPALWVDISALTQTDSDNCLVCGIKGKEIICPNCINGKSLDMFIAQMESASAELPSEKVSGNTDRTEKYDLIEKQLPCPWKEYFRLIKLSAGRFYVGRDKSEDVLALCDSIRQHKGLDQYAGNRAGGILLFTRMINHEYFEAEEIAKKLYQRSDMPYQTYYSLAQFYMKTRRFGNAEQCISKMKAEYSDNVVAVKWIDRIWDEYIKRKSSSRYYTPADKADQEKLYGFLKHLGIMR